MLDKSRTYELAREIGIESPLSFNVHTQDDIAVALERISYPCALKPVHSHAFARHFAGMKAFRVHNDDDMRAALSRTVALGIEMIVTEIIPGRDDQFFSYYSYIDEEGGRCCTSRSASCASTRSGSAPAASTPRTGTPRWPSWGCASSRAWACAGSGTSSSSGTSATGS